MKRKVLLIDLDAQGSLTASCGFAPDDCRSLYEALEGKAHLNEIKITVEDVQVQELVPAGIDLAQADLAFAARIGRENMLRKILNKSRNMTIYCSTALQNLGLITLNALVAATEIVIPVQAENTTPYAASNFYKVL